MEINLEGIKFEDLERIISVILKRCIDALCASDMYGTTPLKRAESLGDKEIIELLQRAQKVKEIINGKSTELLTRYISDSIPSFERILNSKSKKKSKNGKEQALQAQAENYIQKILSKDKTLEDSIEIFLYVPEEVKIKIKEIMRKPLNSRNMTPLHCVNDPAHVEKLLLLDESLCRAETTEGETPLHCLIRTGKIECALVLLKYLTQEHINRANMYGITPIALAILAGNCELVDALMKKGAHIVYGLNNGLRVTYQPIVLLVKQNNDDLTKLVLGHCNRLAFEKGRAYYFTPKYILDLMSIALEYENFYFINLILPNNETINTYKVGGINVLMQAALKRKSKAVKILLLASSLLIREKDSPDLISAKDAQGRTAFMYLFMGPRKVKEQLVRKFIEAQADVHAQDNEGKTVLDYAQEKKVSESILELLHSANN